MQSPPPLPSLALKPASKSLRRNPSHASSYSNASNSATNFGATSSSTLFAKALYDFPAHEPDELYFEEEDLIVIPARTGAGESSTSDWLYGENNGVFGWFPASYVRIVDKVEVEADLNLYCGAWRKVPPRTNLKGVTDSCDSMAVLRGSVDILQAPQSLDSLAGSNFDVSMTSIATQGADGSDSDDDRELSFKPSKSRYQLALRAALTDSPSTNTTQKNTIMHSLGQDDSTCGDSTPKRTPWLHKLRRNSSSFGSASKLKVGVTAPSEAETSSTQTLPQPTADTSDSASLISDASSVVSARAPALTKLAESNPTLSKPIPAPLAPALSNKTVAIMGAPQGLKKLWVESIGGTMALEALGISKMEKQRQEVIYEIVTTEKDYVADLEILLGVFLVRLREGRVVQSKDLGVLFGNLEAILNVNKELLKRLEERQASHKNGVIEQVGDIFIGVTDYLKMYNMYCSNHPYALMKLQAVRQTKSVAKLLDALAALPECRNLDLSNFLLKPVQRICKYPLLVREAIKCTEKTHPDYENLTRALSKIETVVAIVNEGSRQAENVQRMLDFQARLIVKYNIVMPSRILKKNGPIDYINKRGDRKRCELYLFNDVLVLAKPSSNDQLKMMALVPFDMILVNCPNPANVDIKLGRSIGKDLHLIEIVHVNCAKFYLALESVTAKSSWVKALQEATEEWISGKQRMCAMVAAQSYSGSPGMISAPIGVEVVSAKMVEKPEVAESQVAVRRLLPSVPTVEAALKQEVRAKPPSSGSPRRNVQAPVPIGNLAIDAAISVAKLREEKLNAAISNDSLSETEDNRSLVQKAMPPLLVTKKVRNGSPSDGASHFGESGDEMALSSIRHQSGSYQLKSHEKLESLSELSLQRTKLKPVEHFSDNGSQESVAVSNQSLIANANTDATEPTKLISSSRLALNNFIVQDHSRLNSQHPAVSVHPKMTMIPHSSSMSDTHNVKAMATTPPVTQSMPGFRTSCDSKESLAGSLGNVHEAKSSIASLPVAVHNSALAQSNNSLQSLNLPPKNVSDSLISNTKANSEHNIGTASTPVLSSKVSFQSLTSPPKTVSESLMRNAMSEHNTVAYSLSNSTSNGANASLQSPDLKFKETSEFEIKDSKPVGTPSTTTLTSLKVSNASLQSLALHAKVLTDSKLGFTKPKDVLDFNSSFSPKTIVAEITSQPSSTSQPNLPTVVSNASEPITQQQSPYKEQQDPLPNKHSRSYSHQPVSPPRKPLVASQNPTRLDDRQTVLDTEHEPVHARATSAVAAPATSNSRYTGVRARQEMLLMYAFSGGSVGDAGLPGGVARARMFRAEATGETESSGLLGVAEVGKDDWRRSVGAVKSSSSAPVTNSVSTMNEEVVDDDLEGEQVEQMGMNKPVRKLVFQNVLQQTGRYAKEFIYRTRVYHMPSSYSIVHHTFDDFFDFHLHLVAEFPEDAGVGGAHAVRIIPEFPAQMMFVSEAVARVRMTLLQKYCSVIIALPVRISKSPFVMKFFRMNGKHAQTIMATQQIVEKMEEGGAVPVSVGMW